MFKCQMVGNSVCDVMGVCVFACILRVQGQVRVSECESVFVSVRTDNGPEETLKIGRERNEKQRASTWSR